MKTPVQALLACLIGLIALSSCSSGLSIAKTRNSKGYCLHPSSHNGENGPDQKVSLKKTARRIYDEQEGRLLALAGSQNGKTHLATGITDGGHGFREFLIGGPVRSLKSLNARITADPASSEALNMLLVLVLVLLAAYISGMLLDNFGLGWIVHVLLVAILGLTVLWLLNII
jgi:hypothetical protein